MRNSENTLSFFIFASSFLEARGHWLCGRALVSSLVLVQLANCVVDFHACDLEKSPRGKMRFFFDIDADCHAAGVHCFDWQSCVCGFGLAFFSCLMRVLVSICKLQEEPSQV